MKRVLAIENNAGLCWKCLKTIKSQVHIIRIHEMGYGSSFDGESTELHICDECCQESVKDNKEIWSMEEIQCEWDKEDNCGFNEYKYETEMLDYINNLPIQGKQFVRNEFSSDGWHMEAQDWVDYQLDILPHEKCKEYGMYSPQEIRAYADRFTTCEYPTNRIWSDNSKGCYCPFDASGGYGQTVDDNISSECYECRYYKSRVTPIKDIDSEEFKDYMEYLRLKIREDELKSKFQ